MVAVLGRVLPSEEEVVFIHSEVGKYNQKVASSGPEVSWYQ